MIKFARLVWGKIFPPESLEERDEHREARRAEENSQLILHVARRQSEEMTRVSERLKILREENGFGEAVEAAMRRRRES